MFGRNSLARISCIVAVALTTSVKAKECSDEQFSHIEREISGLLKTVNEEHAFPGILLAAESKKHCVNLALATKQKHGEDFKMPSAANSFRTASITKMYTAATALRLVEEGSLVLDNMIDQYLQKPYLDAIIKAGYKPSDISVRHLLNHNSGMADHAQDPRYIQTILQNPKKQWTPLEQVQLLAEYDMKKTAPNVAFSYSDTGYILLGRIIEQVSGKSLPKAVRHYLSFEELGIKDTYFEQGDKIESSAVRAHQMLGPMDTLDWNPSMDMFGGGGQVTTAADLSKFIRALFEGKVFKKESSLALMTDLQPDSYKDGYGMGMFKVNMKNTYALGHTGFWNTFVFYLPEMDMTIAGALLRHDGIPGPELVKKVVKEIKRLSH